MFDTCDYYLIQISLFYSSYETVYAAISNKDERISEDTQKRRYQRKNAMRIRRCIKDIEGKKQVDMGDDSKIINNKTATI